MSLDVAPIAVPVTQTCSVFLNQEKVVLLPVDKPILHTRFFNVFYEAQMVESSDKQKAPRTFFAVDIKWCTTGLLATIFESVDFSYITEGNVKECLITHSYLQYDAGIGTCDAILVNSQDEKLLKWASKWDLSPLPMTRKKLNEPLLFVDHKKYAAIGRRISSSAAISSGAALQAAIQPEGEIDYLNLSTSYKIEEKQCSGMRERSTGGHLNLMTERYETWTERYRISWVTDEVIQRLLVHLPNIRFLNLENTEVTRAILPTLDTLAHLKEVAGLYVPQVPASLSHIKFHPQVPSSWTNESTCSIM